MKAVQISRFGGPEVLEVADLPSPEPGSGEVLVRVRAVGVNFFEVLMRQDRYAVTPPLPAVLGSEAAGTVEALGSGVTSPAIGTRVAVPLFAAGHSLGSYCEEIAIDARYAVPLPDALPFEAATALMVQGLTALHLVEQAPPKGKTVLVNAAAGGVGSLLVQLAKRAGARWVFAAASTAEKRALARSLGADGDVDYTRADWPGILCAATGGAGADIIYESVGGAVAPACLDALAPLGRLVIYGALNLQDFHLGVPELRKLIFSNRSLTGFGLVPLLTPENVHAGLTELFELAVSGALKVTIGGTYPLAQAAEAHRALEKRASTGKLVLTV